MALGKALLLQLHLCVLCPFPSYAVLWQYHLPQQSIACAYMQHVFVMQQDARLA